MTDALHEPGYLHMLPRKTAVVGVASGYGAGDRECQDGPEVLRTMEILRDLENCGGSFHWDDIIHPLFSSGVEPLLVVRDVARRVAQAVAGHLAAGDFPLVIGGDHSCAIGTWSGVHAHLQSTVGADARLGLIWVDAHMDSHTPRTSPSHNLHGMPLACLLGRGEPQLTEIGGVGPKLHPEDVCLIGVRSFEWSEAALLRTLGVRVYFMDEVHRRGMDAVLEEARQHVGAATAGYGISIDLDAFDPREAAGVGTPAADGLTRDEVTRAFGALSGDPHLLALEIVEYNPYKDLHFATAAVVRDVCSALLCQPHAAP